MPVNKNVFLHDDDKAALQALKSIPGFTQFLKAFMSMWNEKAFRIANMSTNVRISKEQLPKYYDMLPPICAKLGIEVPELYLKLDPYPNSYTSGDEKPFIVITSSLIDVLPEELIPTVLAHECGHIACHHVLYHTMGQMILNGMLAALPVAKVLTFPIQAAFAYWMRCSEFSADRAAILCDGGPEKMMEVCARFAGYDKDIHEPINMEAFMDQARDYKELIESSSFNKGLETILFSMNSHPINAVRAYEANEWAKSENYQRAKEYFASYDAGMLPDELPLPWDERGVLGQDAAKVEEELRGLGFRNIELQRSTDRPLFSKDNSIYGVNVNGFRSFAEGDWVTPDTKIVLRYYKSLSEDELKALHPGEIRLPRSARFLEGEKYFFVEKELRDAGYTNIHCEPIKDIVRDDDRNRYRVTSVSVNGDNKRSRGDWIKADTPIAIYYHDKIH
ncbi:MAG: M48 family metallopeptidase [Erysipelotrichaceae bacterium]|nr:M48 family metallopeptidase [Erysipelotrichaceae bacterium]